MAWGLLQPALPLGNNHPWPQPGLPRKARQWRLGLGLTGLAGSAALSNVANCATDGVCGHQEAEGLVQVFLREKVGLRALFGLGLWHGFGFGLVFPPGPKLRPGPVPLERRAAVELAPRRERHREGSIGVRGMVSYSFLAAFGVGVVGTVMFVSRAGVRMRLRKHLG